MPTESQLASPVRRRVSQEILSTLNQIIKIAGKARLKAFKARLS